MPEERNEETSPRKRGKKKLTLYGRWIERMCTYLEVTPTAVARKAEIHPTTIGKIMKEGEYTNDPGRDTALVVCQAMRAIAQEKGKYWYPAWETMMHNAAGLATYEQILDAKNGLDTIPLVRKTRKRRKRNTTG